MKVDVKIEGQKELRDNIKRVLDALSVRERRKVLRKAAAPMQEKARQLAPVAEKEVHRYGTEKIFRRIRAPKGKGTVVATYVPGNLEKSIQLLTFRRSPDIFIGPKKASRNKQPVYGLSEKVVDPYYAHMVHNGTRYAKGTPFMTMAFHAKKTEVLRIIRSELKDKIEKAPQTTP